MKNAAKRELLKAVMDGDLDRLRQYKAIQPPIYTPERLEERRQYLGQLLGRPCTDVEVDRFWGKYDIGRWQTPDRLIICVELPNGMKHYPAYCHGISPL